MKEYKRFTERIGKSICIKETSTNDNKSIWNAIERLAELEDKIENGKLVEIPPLISYNEHLKKYEVLSYEIEIYVKEYCKTKTEAEKKLAQLLKEKQNG